ncbi:MAG: hypothetical protein AAF689_14555 [Pseudomonadota bacterium]
MRRFKEFLGNESGQASGGAVIYMLVLGLFLATVMAMAPVAGPRTIAHNGDAVEVQAPRWLTDTFGPRLPQIGPLTAGR